MATYYSNASLGVVDENSDVHVVYPVTHGGNVIIEPPSEGIDPSSTQAETVEELVSHLKSGAFRQVANNDTFPIGEGSDVGSVNMIANTAQLGKLYSELNSNYNSLASSLSEQLGIVTDDQTQEQHITISHIICGKIPVNPTDEDKNDLNIWIES